MRELALSRLTEPHARYPRQLSRAVILLPRWRSWQTRLVQDQVSARTGGFESLVGHAVQGE